MADRTEPTRAELIRAFLAADVVRTEDYSWDTPTLVEAERMADAALAAADQDGRQRGMEVDGDMLRDAIAEAAPREWTDTAARELADRALDAAVRAGITVLHGPDLTPRAAPAPISDPHGALIAELQGQVNARADAGERMATAFDALDRALARGAWIGSERTALRGAVADWRAGR